MDCAEYLITMRKNIGGSVSRFVFFTAGFLVIVLVLGIYAIAPRNGDAEQSIIFHIAKGEGVREIAGRLGEERIIRSPFAFTVFAVLSGRGRTFKPGTYTLSPALSVPEIIFVLTAEKREEREVLVPEGYTVRDVASLLFAEGILREDSFQNLPWDEFREVYPFLGGTENLEGFLYPDTYRFHPGSNSAEVVRKFLDNFSAKAWNELQERDDWYEVLIMASLLEKEVVAFDERRIVAGILFKRLQEGIPLQVDATVFYAVCEKLFARCGHRKLFKSDFEIVSEYNTYKRLGLPPTPIANPGISAIRAALLPEKSPYWYYLTDPETKKTIFSRTLEEHNKNRARYLF